MRAGFTTAPEAFKTSTRQSPRMPEQTALQEDVHQGHWDERIRAIEVLLASPLPFLVRMGLRMAGCCASVFLFVDHEQRKVREHVHMCRSRLCEYCARIRTLHVAHQIAAAIRLMARPRHLVLTVKSEDTDLDKQIRQLRKWFRKLRATAWWKKNVIGGIYTIEATINERTGLWHPHIHCVFDGQYLPFKKIQFEWHKITGDSDVVWIEEVHNPNDMALELAKYIGKPQDSEHWTDAQFAHYAAATHGMRMVQTFGKRPPKPIVDEVPDEPLTVNESHISLAELLWMVRNDNAAAVAAALLIAERWPHLGRLVFHRFPQLEPDDARYRRLLHLEAIIAPGPGAPSRASPPPRDPAIIEAELCYALNRIYGPSPYNDEAP